MAFRRFRQAVVGGIIIASIGLCTQVPAFARPPIPIPIPVPIPIFVPPPPEVVVGVPLPTPVYYEDAYPRHHHHHRYYREGRWDGDRHWEGRRHFYRESRWEDERHRGGYRSW